MKPLFPGRRFSFLRLFIAILCIALVAAGTWSWITFTRTAAKKLPEPWFGGYVDVTATPSYEFESKVGNVYRNVILGFVTAGDGCQPSWGGYYTLDEAASTLDLDSRIAQTYKTDRTVTVSFGGQNGTELASACSDVDSLAGRIPAGDQPLSHHLARLRHRKLESRRVQRNRNPASASPWQNSSPTKKPKTKGKTIPVTI